MIYIGPRYFSGSKFGLNMTPTSIEIWCPCTMIVIDRPFKGFRSGRNTEAAADRGIVGNHDETNEP